MLKDFGGVFCCNTIRISAKIAIRIFAEIFYCEIPLSCQRSLESWHRIFYNLEKDEGGTLTLIKTIKSKIK
jgi:hypothetical protein